jgi:hypothetical protein
MDFRADTMSDHSRQFTIPRTPLDQMVEPAIALAEEHGSAVPGQVAGIANDVFPVVVDLPQFLS